jgi:hypothetical protein
MLFHQLGEILDETGVALPPPDAIPSPTLFLPTRTAAEVVLIYGAVDLEVGGKETAPVATVTAGQEEEGWVDGPGMGRWKWQRPLPSSSVFDSVAVSTKQREVSCWP